MPIVNCDEVEVSPSLPKKTGKDRWNLLRNTVRATQLFRHMDVIHNRLSSILDDVQRIPTDHAYRKEAKAERLNSMFN
jgi:hypothetical protein